jgi:hypothetical protein
MWPLDMTRCLSKPLYFLIEPVFADIISGSLDRVCFLDFHRANLIGLQSTQHILQYAFHNMLVIGHHQGCHRIVRIAYRGETELAYLKECGERENVTWET